MPPSGLQAFGPWPSGGMWPLGRHLFPYSLVRGAILSQNPTGWGGIFYHNLSVFMRVLYLSHKLLFPASLSALMDHAAKAGIKPAEKTHRGNPIKRAKWHLGIRSQSKPQDIMNEVYRAMKALDFVSSSGAETLLQNFTG